MNLKLLQFLFFIFLAAALPVRAADVLYPVEATIYVCNNNNLCEPENGENPSNCFSDCGCNNDLSCDANRLENAQNCPMDCLTDLCGNGVCDSGLGETFGNCPSDCHCGNGVCDWSETSASCPADCRSVGSPMIFLSIDNVQIKQKSGSEAFINWTTNYRSACQLYWGTNTHYGAGVANESFEAQSHSIPLSGLRSNVPYYFKIFCQDSAGRKTTLENISFLIKEEIIITTSTKNILNVDNLAIVADGHEAELSWNDPVGKNYNEIIIRRSRNFYPSFDSGDIIYRGPGTSQGGKLMAIDSGFNNQTAYYSVFATDGTYYSSGVLIALIVLQTKVITVISPVTDIPALILPSESLTKIYRLSLYDFDFINGGQKLPFIGDQVILNSGRLPLIVSVEASKIPKEISNLILNVSGDNWQQSYFMSRDFDGKKLSAVIGGLLIGDYKINIILFDQGSRPVKEIGGRIKSKTEDLFLGAGGFLHSKSILIQTLENIFKAHNSFARLLVKCWLITTLLLLFLLLLLLFLWMRRKKKEAEKK